MFLNESKALYTRVPHLATQLQINKDLNELSDSKQTDVSLWKANYHSESPKIAFSKRYYSEK